MPPWGLAALPYSHRAMPGTALHHKGENRDPPLPQGIAVAGRWGQLPAAALISPEKSRVGPEMPRAAICSWGPACSRTEEKVHQRELPFDGKEKTLWLYQYPSKLGSINPGGYCCQIKKSVYHKQDTSSFIPYPDTYVNVVPQGAGLTGS